MFYQVLLVLSLSACVQKVLLPARSLPQNEPAREAARFTFVFDGVEAEVETVVVSFEPARAQLAAAQPVLRARLRVNTKDKVCRHAEAFKLQRHNAVGKLDCRAAPRYHDASNEFGDKLYFFPRGGYCQVGRLIREQSNSYEVEFCGVRDAGGDFHDCVACEPNCGNLKATTVPQQNFELAQAAYPFDPLAGLQLSYELQVREKNSLWQTRRVTLNGNGVLAAGHSCRFRDGCQVRSDPRAGKCVTPSP